MREIIYLSETEKAKKCMYFKTYGDKGKIVAKVVFTCIHFFSHDIEASYINAIHKHRRKFIHISIKRKEIYIGDTYTLLRQ